MNFIKNFLREEEGATAVEYGLMVAAIAAVIVVTVFAIGAKVEVAFKTVCNALTNAGYTAGTC